MTVCIKQKWHIPKQQPQATETELVLLYGLINLIDKMLNPAWEKYSLS